MATFLANVVLANGQVHLVGDEVPESAYGQITNLDVVDGDISVSSSDTLGKPPVRGAGSSRDAWAAYATAQGIEFEPDATATAIQAAVDTHEVQAAEAATTGS